MNFLDLVKLKLINEMNSMFTIYPVSRNTRTEIDPQHLLWILHCRWFLTNESPGKPKEATYIFSNSLVRWYFRNAVFPILPSLNKGKFQNWTLEFSCAATVMLLGWGEETRPAWQCVGSTPCAQGPQTSTLAPGHWTQHM